MTDRELMQQALEALEEMSGGYCGNLITALRNRLALSYVPKVWMQCPECGKKSPMPDPDHKEWRGLTQEEVLEVLRDDVADARWVSTPYTAARAIEAKLKEKNT